MDIGSNESQKTGISRINKVDRRRLAEAASKNYREINRTVMEVKKNLWALAILLKECRDKKLYKFYNDTFEEYLANPSISLSRFFVYKIIRNFEVWVGDYDVSQEKLQDIDSEKLYIAGTMLTEGNYQKSECQTYQEFMEETLEQARNLSRSDLKMLKSGKEYRFDPNKYKMVTCPKCGFEIKVVL